ncbi:C-type lectin domain family 4 member M [Elysia marginata]|uniref:C-type lectin domain family 4 member M n=1 Tax=Elysia marginata TaxID=1093978 RepID=A0AAV4IL67_9GAST|nr:C-type lectin domain family 4 member M [Elysia marginata]
MMTDRLGWSNSRLVALILPFVLTCHVLQGAVTKCGTPGPAPDGKPVGELKSNYAVGETVTYKCDYIHNTKVRTCLESGKWSSMGQVCAECPDEFTFNEGFQKCLLYRDVLVDGNTAIKACEDLGAALAFPMTEEENVILSKMKRYGIFMGITDKQKEGTFITVTGEPLQYTHWHGGEPNDYGHGEDCVEQGGGWWNDLPCTVHTRHYFCQTPKTVFKHCLDFEEDCAERFDKNPTMCKDDPKQAEEKCRFTCGFCGQDDTPKCTVDTPGAEHGDTKVLTRGESIELACEKGHIALSGDRVRGCEKDGRLSGKPLECTRTCPRDWKLNMANKHCYKLFKSPKNYTAAEADCADKAGTLATASDLQEQNFLADLTKSTQEIWLGLSDSLVEGTFRWVDGKLLDFTNWNAGEPNNANEEDCGQMVKNKKWNDKDCKVQLMYVCKVDVEHFGDYSWFWSTLRGGVSTLESFFGF